MESETIFENKRTLLNFSAGNKKITHIYFKYNARNQISERRPLEKVEKFICNFIISNENENERKSYNVILMNEDITEFNLNLKENDKITEISLFHPANLSVNGLKGMLDIFPLGISNPIITFFFASQ